MREIFRRARGLSLSLSLRLAVPPAEELRTPLIRGGFARRETRQFCADGATHGRIAAVAATATTTATAAATAASISKAPMVSPSGLPAHLELSPCLPLSLCA